MGSSQSQTDVYSDAASFGRLYSTIGLIIAIIVGLIMLAAGIYLLNKKNTHTDKVIASIKDPILCEGIFAPNSTRTCTVTLQFTYNGQVYNVPNYSYSYYVTSNTSSDPSILRNTNISVYVDPTNPVDVSSTSSETDRYMAFAVIGMGIFVVAIAAFQWWLTRKSKFFAAAEGTGAGISMVRRVVF